MQMLMPIMTIGPQHKFRELGISQLAEMFKMERVLFVLHIRT
jgi:hypothetical protein